MNNNLFAQLALANGFKLIYFKVEGIMERAIISNEQEDYKPYYSDKETVVLDNQIFTSERFYDSASQNLTVKSKKSFLTEEILHQPILSNINSAFVNGLKISMYNSEDGQSLLTLGLPQNNLEIKKTEDVNSGRVEDYVIKETLTVADKHYVTERQYDPESQTFNVVKNSVNY